jgi:hypothetical protein
MRLPRGVGVGVWATRLIPFLIPFHKMTTSAHSRHSVVGSSMTNIFQTMRDRLYDATTTTDFDKAASDMLARFPKAQTLKSWWTQPGHRLMIFKANQNEELKEDFTKNSTCNQRTKFLRVTTEAQTGF